MREAVPILVAHAAGVLCSLVTVAAVYLVGHRRSVYEISVLRTLVKVLKVLLGLGMALVLPLVYYCFGGRGDGFSPGGGGGVAPPAPVIGWGRPLLGLTSRFLGLFLEYSSKLVWLCSLGLGMGLVLDTYSFCVLNWQMDCVEANRCTLSPEYTLEGLKWLQVRDLAAIVESSWTLVIALYVGVIFGGKFCGSPSSSRYHPKLFRGVAWGGRVIPLRRELQGWETPIA